MTLEVPLSAKPKPELKSAKRKNSSSGQSGMLPPKSAAETGAVRGIRLGGVLITPTGSSAAGFLGVGGGELLNCWSTADQSGRVPVMPPAAQPMSSSL